MVSFKKILFPVDLSESSEHLVPVVKELSIKLEAEIHLLFVARVFGYFATIYVENKMISDMEKAVIKGAQKKMDEFVKRYFQGIDNVKSTVMPGDAAEVIMEFAENNGFDMIVMGTHGRKGLEKILFGSVAEQVVKGSPIPVTVVNPHKPSG